MLRSLSFNIGQPKLNKVCLAINIVAKLNKVCLAINIVEGFDFFHYFLLTLVQSSIKS